MTLQPYKDVFLLYIPSSEWSGYTDEVRRIFRMYALKASYRRRTLVLTFSAAWLKNCRNRLAFQGLVIPHPTPQVQ